MMENEKYISEIDNKFSVDRIFNEKKYNFGIFDTYDEALEQLEYLEEEGWPILTEDLKKDVVTDNLGLSLNNIEEMNGKFVVYKYIMGEKNIFGEYDSLNDAKRIKNNLISNAWESMEENNNSTYAKYIRKNGEKFVVSRIYNGKYYYFGQFNSFEEALEHREYLIANNWDKLNIPLKMKYGKYISFNGKMYTIQKMLNGKLHIYGFFNDLDNAKKQRDWLVKNNWSRLEVPDDSNKHIHKQGNEYLIYLRLENDLEYFGTYSSLEEAKIMRNKLIENDWVLEDPNIIEKISDYVYFDGEFYYIEPEIDGQKRIYGVYKNKNQAIIDEKSFIDLDWEGCYAIPTEEYPYGENIVPFDYIFILEKNENGVKEELGTYTSFKEAVFAKKEKIDDCSNKYNKLIFSVKVGKSYKNRGWSIFRDSTYDLIPKLPYEDECDIIVDGIPTTAKFNLLPRIFYNKTDDIVNHLENLAKKNPNSRINVELLLNKENIDSNDKYDVSTNEIFNKNRTFKLENSVNELEENLISLKNENKILLEKFDRINNLIQNFGEVDLSIDELNSIDNSNLRLKILHMKDIIKELKEELDND